MDSPLNFFEKFSDVFGINMNFLESEIKETQIKIVPGNKEKS